MNGKLLNKISLFLMIAAFASAGACPILYNVIGSYVAEDGLLVEPFYLVPMGYLFLLGGIICLIVFCITKRKMKAPTPG